MRLMRALVVGLTLVLPYPAATRAQPTDVTSSFVARWNLTHGKYLVDVGQYLEALEAFDTTIEMSTVDEVRLDALLQKASVLAVFLDAADDAIRLYDALVMQYPSSAAAPIAVFRAGMTLFDRGQYDRAAMYFERYLKQYPTGASRGSAQFLLQQSRAKAGSEPAPAAPPSITSVRVRILKGHGRAQIESAGALAVTPAVARGPILELKAHGGLVQVGAQPGVREITVSAERPLVIRIGGAVHQYRGALVVRADGDTLQLINRLGVEEYLYGVVTKESVASWPAEALKAQAIASRSYALYQAQHRQDRAYDMVDDEGSQVYGGVGGESAPGRRAVDGTRGVTLTYRGRPIYAMFTANAGWYTGDPAYIFNQPLPYLVAVPDPYSPNEQMGRWTRSYSVSEIRRLLAAIGVTLGSIRAIEPRVICPSGRIVRVDIVDEHGPHAMRTRPTLGRALKLPEILLGVRREGDRFIFAGGGFGHGVGLSQWGAKAMADKGASAKEILAFYYREVEMTPVAQ